MKTYARIENDTVVELFKTDGDISEMFHSDMVWEDVTGVPGITERWRKIEGGFAPPTPTPLVEIKLSVWADIKAERDRRKAGGVKVGAKWFHSDDGSCIQQMGLVMMGASIPAGLQWKTMDGSFITMTQALATSVFGAAAASDQVIFGAAETHRVAMEASADPASYDYSGGWPKVYGE